MPTLYWVFRAAGHPVEPGVLLAGYGIPLMTGELTVLQGGPGSVAGPAATLDEGPGLPSPVTVGLVLPCRPMRPWLPPPIGVPIEVFLRHSATGTSIRPRVRWGWAARSRSG